MGFLKRIRETAVVRGINEFIDSKYMLAILAGMTLLSNLFGLEFFLYVFVALIGYYLCFFGKDFLFLAPVVVFMYISPSVKNNPFHNENSIFFPGQGLEFVVALAVVFFVLFFLRLAADGDLIRFFKEKRSLNIGFLLLFVVFLLGGLGYEKYSVQNIPYSIALFACFFLPYFILTGAVKWEEVKKDYFAWAGMIVGLTALGELLGVYVMNHDLMIEFGNNRADIFTGWGTYTSISIVLAISMPFCFYLAAKHRYGAVFNVLGNLLFVGVILTQCRGSILFGAVAYLACAVAVLTNRKNRSVNAFIYGLVLGCGSLLILNESTLQLLEKFQAIGDSYRKVIFNDAISSFLQNPVFGRGFYGCTVASYDNPVGASFIPPFWHNTVLQMMAACGSVGLLAYLFHRVQTVILFIRRVNRESVFLAISVLTLLF